MVNSLAGLGKKQIRHAEVRIAPAVLPASALASACFDGAH